MSGWANNRCWRHGAEGGAGGAWNPGTVTNKVTNKKKMAQEMFGERERIETRNKAKMLEWQKVF